LGPRPGHAIREVGDRGAGAHPGAAAPARGAARWARRTSVADRGAGHDRDPGRPVRQRAAPMGGRAGAGTAASIPVHARPGLPGPIPRRAPATGCLSAPTGAVRWSATGRRAPATGCARRALTAGADPNGESVPAHRAGLLAPGGCGRLHHHLPGVEPAPAAPARGDPAVALDGGRRLRVLRRRVSRAWRSVSPGAPELLTPWRRYAGESNPARTERELAGAPR